MVEKRADLELRLTNDDFRNIDLMVKKVFGYILLLFASFSIIFFIYRIIINSRSIVIFKGIVRGELGSWTLVIFVIHLLFFLIIYLMIKYGFLWIKHSKVN